MWKIKLCFFVIEISCKTHLARLVEWLDVLRLSSMILNAVDRKIIFKCTNNMQYQTDQQRITTIKKSSMIYPPYKWVDD